MNLAPSDATDAPTTSAAESSTSPTVPPVLDHERLHCYAAALEFAALVPELTRGARASLRDQLERAAASTCLNLAEGCGRRARRDRLHFFAMAQGCRTSPLRGLLHLTGPSALASAMECAAAVDILRVTGSVTLANATRAKHKLARVAQMLVGLRRA
jgi:hypothetical protein